MMCLVHLLRVGLFCVLGPAQLPESGADVADAGRGTADVTLPPAALMRRPGEALGAGEPAVRAG
jgi:hypothetical protein